MAADDAPPICRAGGKGGMIFPLGLEEEATWPDGVRGFLYAFGMVYWFLGVAIAADLFMASIETVTSARKKAVGPDGKVRTAKVWNETVATLTLMALGSSAPEIFLSVIDIVKKEFHFGALGPSTIVGSAAFNLLVILAVCIVVIPSTEVRVIKNLPAFYITAVFSMVAYIWMALILSAISPDIVELWEAVLTFLMLPLLVFVSYKTDRGDADAVLRRLRLLAADVEEEEENLDGFVSFSTELVQVHGSESDMTIEVIVARRKVMRAPERVSCSYRTEGRTAVVGCDFEEAEGTLEFDAGETEKTLSFTILGRPRRFADCEFLVVLEGLEGGPVFDPDQDGGEDEAILTVSISKHGPEASAMRRRLNSVWNTDRMWVAWEEWREQVVSTCFVNGSLEEQREAGVADWAMHLLALPWKLAFSLLPPTSLMGGWACFFASLVGIAVLTTCVSDLAELFGCVVGIPDIVTAVTFVALGTSMPDLFASLTAAKEDPTADASIVNVTGSNSVNVYLGLGVPWTVAAIFWQVKGRTDEWESLYPEVAARISGGAFVVESDNLGFSVGMFCYICVLALGILYARRRFLGCELGGPLVAKLLSFATFIAFWIAWVAIVSWRVMSPSPSVRENAGVYGAMFVSTVGATVVLTIVTQRSFVPQPEPAEDEEQRQVADGVPTKQVEEADVQAPAAAKDVVPIPTKVDKETWDESFFADDLGEEKSREPTATGPSCRPASVRGY